MGQEGGATVQDRVAYWRRAWEDFQRARPKLPQVAEGPPATPREAQARGAVEALRRRAAALDARYRADQATLEGEHARGYPGLPDWRRAQLSKEHGGRQADLYEAYIKERMAAVAELDEARRALARVEQAARAEARERAFRAARAVGPEGFESLSYSDAQRLLKDLGPEAAAMLLKEYVAWKVRREGAVTGRALQAADWYKELTGEALPVPRPAAERFPVWFEELKILARNFTGASEAAFRTRPGTTGRAQASAEVDRAKREFKDSFDSRTGGMSEKERGDLFWEFLRWAYGGSANVPHAVAAFLYPGAPPKPAEKPPPPRRPTGMAPAPAPARPARVLPGPLAWEPAPAPPRAPARFIVPFAEGGLPIWAT